MFLLLLRYKGSCVVCVSGMGGNLDFLRRRRLPTSRNSESCSPGYGIQQFSEISRHWHAPGAIVCKLWPKISYFFIVKVGEIERSQLKTSPSPPSLSIFNGPFATDDDHHSPFPYFISRDFPRMRRRRRRDTAHLILYQQQRTFLYIFRRFVVYRNLGKLAFLFV